MTTCKRPGRPRLTEVVDAGLWTEKVNEDLRVFHDLAPPPGHQPLHALNTPIARRTRPAARKKEATEEAEPRSQRVGRDERCYNSVRVPTTRPRPDPPFRE